MPGAPASLGPCYPGIDSREALRKSVCANILFRMIDAQLPRSVTVMEAGCGDGRLTNFLAMSPWRRVLGCDSDQSLLAHADDFRRRFEINNAAFVRTDVSRLPFGRGSLDVVISGDALHRTPNARDMFAELAGLLRPGGLFIASLRSAYARVKAPAPGTTHSLGEALGWFDQSGVEFLSAVPAPDGQAVDEADDLFAPHSRAGPLRRFLSQLTPRFEKSAEAATFTVIGRKRG